MGQPQERKLTLTGAQKKQWEKNKKHKKKRNNKTSHLWPPRFLPPWNHPLPPFDQATRVGQGKPRERWAATWHPRGCPFLSSPRDQIHRSGISERRVIHQKWNTTHDTLLLTLLDLVMDN